MALFACGMQIAANFINDLYDYLKGVTVQTASAPNVPAHKAGLLPQP